METAMTTTTTPLGRSVSIDDWKAYQGDVVLKYLHDCDTPRNLRQITNASAIAGFREAKQVCEYLQEQFLVEAMFSLHLPPADRAAEAFYYEITAAGKKFAAACLDGRFLVAEQIVHEAKLNKQMSDTSAAILKQLDEMNDRLDRGIPGNLVAISKKLREAILRELKVPKKDWKLVQVSADLRRKPDDIAAKRDAMAKR